MAITVSFNATNPRAQQWAAMYGGTRVTNITADVEAAIRSVIVRSIRQGIPPYDAARIISTMVGMNERQAQAAMNYREDLIGLGLRIDQVDAKMQRYIEDKIDERADMIARTECLTPDTLVDGAVVWAVHRRPYEGPLVEVRTDAGREFSATPNHPMLTNRGWLPAGQIAEGDYLICDGGQEHTGAPGDEHVADPPATLSEIFDAVAAVGIVERRRTGEPDFHGDGREGEVEIARPGRELRRGLFSAIHKESLESILSPADLAMLPLCGACGRLLEVNEQPCCCNGPLGDPALLKAPEDHAIADAQRLGDSAGGLASQVALADGVDVDVIAVGGASAAALEECASCIGERPHDSGSPNSPEHEVIGGAHSRGHQPQARSGSVLLDRVSRCAVRQWHGHVFNLSTPYGYYTINGGILTGNTLSALNEGALDAYREAADAGLLGGGATKEWIVTDDEKLCPDCEELDGEQVPMEEEFSAGVMTPPLHPNCRCAMAVTEELGGTTITQGE